MEMDLQQTVLESYRTVLDTAVSREEVMESIVPDAFPDVARVISVDGAFCLTGKEVSAGSARLTGTLSMTVLYVPDEGEGVVTSLTVKQPVQLGCDSPQLTEECQVQGAVCSVQGSGRLINPRKLFLKAELRAWLRAYAPDRRAVTSGITCDPGDSIQKRCVSSQDCAVAAVLEKPFLFSDVLRPSASKPPMDALLLSCVRPVALDVKYIGKRLICKGEMVLDVLYRSGGETASAVFELPYSQVMDFEGSFEEGEPDVAAAVRSVEVALREGELEVSVECLLQAALWARRKVTVLSDLYSTAQPLEVDCSICTLCADRLQESRRESARQFFPSEIPARQVLRCSAEAVSFHGENGRCDAEAEVTVLCLSESGTLYSAGYLLPVSCTAEVPEGCGCTWRCGCCEVTAVPVTGGLEVRLEMEFSWTALTMTDLSYVFSVRECPAPAAQGPRPSVVVRPIGPGETLWDVAKACGAAVEDICAVNALAGEGAAQPGTVLLIPSKRV